ncbi:MAG: hypothetical protein QOF76_183 [Solirubrobacteraceae bacterium]|jgi:cytochrome P450|nr:hypothetical protein [Solirubrobacteraceae bacterium]
MRASSLPPGRRLPVPVQTVGFMTRPTVGLETLRRKFGTPFTMRLLGQPPFVIFGTPEHAKAILTAPPEVLHPGEGARLLGPLLGKHSVILLDEEPHLEQRRLLLPAFHGDRMKRLEGIMEELVERELDRWPLEQEVELHPRLQALTLEIILRTVFGLDEGPRLDRLREQLPALASFMDSPVSMLPALQRGTRGPWARFQRLRAVVDGELYALMDERRAEGDTDRDDVLATLLAATHLDGSPMTNDEIRDELLTALVAGHETTASALSFAFAEIARRPDVGERLASGDADYREAVINETLRRRPTLPNPEPRQVMQPFTVGDRTYEPGVVLMISAYLIHHDPAIYPEPYAFRPERFEGTKPGTYTWLPFGGGRRRCLGAAFSQVEMRIALRQALARFTVAPAAPGPAGVRRRMITITPRDGARVVLSERARLRTPPALAASAAA